MKKWLYPILVLSIASFLSGLSLTVLSGAGDETRAEEPAKAEGTETKSDAETHADVGAATDAPKEEEHAKQVAPSKRILSSKYAGCLTDETALREVEKARQELAAKTKALEVRATELDSREKALKDELAKLDEIQKQIKVSQDQLSAKDEEKIAKLVEMFESMSPKAAAQIVGSVDLKLATQAMSRVTPQKLGKILAAMPSQKSSQLTEALAGTVRAKAETPSSMDGAATVDAGKAGEKNNANSNNNPINPTDSGNGGRREPAGQKPPRTPAL